MCPQPYPHFDNILVWFEAQIHSCFHCAPPFSACTPWDLPCPCAALHIDLGLFRLPEGTREMKLYDKWACSEAQTHMCLVHLKSKLNSPRKYFFFYKLIQEHDETQQRKKNTNFHFLSHSH